MNGPAVHSCGVTLEDGSTCAYSHPAPTVVGQHRKIEHGVEGKSRTATRARALTSTSRPTEPPCEWGEWTERDLIVLRALALSWGKDLPGTVAELRSRTLATVLRNPSVRRLLAQDEVLQAERRSHLQSV